MPAPCRAVCRTTSAVLAALLLAAPAAARAQATSVAVPAGMAGMWRVKVMSENGDSLTTYRLQAPAGSRRWVLFRPGAQSVVTRVVAADGDSVVAEAGPYASTIRRGSRVRTRTVFRLSGDRLVGETEAHYMRGGTDSTTVVRLEGTRMR